MISKQDLLGAWRLESWTVGYSDRDDFSYPYGEDPQGLLVYSDDGWMSACIARRDRALFPDNVNYRKIPDADRTFSGVGPDKSPASCNDRRRDSDF